MCDPYILLQLRGTTRIDPPHSIHTRTGSGKIGEERRRSSLTRGLARASPGRSCCSCARASSCSFVRASSLASLASLLSSLRSLGTFVIGRSSWGARTKLLLAVLSGLRSGPEECQQHPAETRRIAAANCADCVPRIAPTAPNRCDADLADATAADTENAHYTRREPGVRVVDSKVTSTQDGIQVVSRHCLCVTHTGFGLSPGSRQRLKCTIVLPVGRRRLLSRFVPSSYSPYRELTNSVWQPASSSRRRRAPQRCSRRTRRC